MRNEDRKAAITAYKERKIEVGIYAIRCARSGEVWLGGTPDLSKIQNRHWFSLRQGLSTEKSLQGAWDVHGEEAFAFEIVDRFDEEAIGYVRSLMMKERLAYWLAQLGAVRI